MLDAWLTDNINVINVNFELNLGEQLTTTPIGHLDTVVPLVSFAGKKILRDGESNPGLPRDRRGYSPLYYRGVVRSGVDNKFKL